MPDISIHVLLCGAVVTNAPFLLVAVNPLVLIAINPCFGVKARLELISACCSGHISLFPLGVHLLSRLPLERLQSLREDRVREMITGKRPVGIHGAQVLNLELDQRAGEFVIVPKLVGKGIGLELELAAQDVEEKLDNQIGGAKDIREQKEPDDDGLLGSETESGIQRLVVDKRREERKDVEKVQLKSQPRSFRHG